jgi:hypothetical protein
MTKTKIEQVFRATIYVASVAGDDNALDRSSKFEKKAGFIANRHSVAFQSLNTQVLSDCTLQLESNVRENVERAVKDIESLLSRFKYLRLYDID